MTVHKRMETIQGRKLLAEIRYLQVQLSAAHTAPEMSVSNPGQCLCKFALIIMCMVLIMYFDTFLFFIVTIKYISNFLT